MLLCIIIVVIIEVCLVRHGMGFLWFIGLFHCLILSGKNFANIFHTPYMSKILYCPDIDSRLVLLMSWIPSDDVFNEQPKCVSWLQMILSKSVDLIQMGFCCFCFQNNVLYCNSSIQRKCINCSNANKVRVINLIEQM